jgi:hypothetical protein
VIQPWSRGPQASCKSRSTPFGVAASMMPKAATPMPASRTMRSVQRAQAWSAHVGRDLSRLYCSSAPRAPATQAATTYGTADRKLDQPTALCNASSSTSNRSLMSSGGLGSIRPRSRRPRKSFSVSPTRSLAALAMATVSKGQVGELESSFAVLHVLRRRWLRTCHAFSPFVREGGELTLSSDRTHLGQPVGRSEPLGKFSDTPWTGFAASDLPPLRISLRPSGQVPSTFPR